MIDLQRARRRLRRAAPVLLALAVVLLAGCQARVAVDAKVRADGSGVLTVGVGLDDAALARVGDLDAAAHLGDLPAAGWSVGRATKGTDGLTWLRATKAFASVDELNRSLAEITGSPGLVRDVRLVTEDGGTTTVHRLTGTIDTTRGLALFGDDQLRARLGADPLGDPVAAIEKAEGKPVADLVLFDVSASLGDAVQTWHPTLRDREPVRLDVSTSEPKPAASLGGGGPVGILFMAAVGVAVLLVGARRRFLRTPP